MTGDRIVLYGDFSCPWSYLASRRAAMLSGAGVTVDWRAVEHAPPRAGVTVDRSARFRSEQAEIERIVEVLLPGEGLPYTLAGFVPDTGASVAAYAEAYAAGRAALVRQVLFEAFWLHAFDLDDARVVRTLVTDAVRSDASLDGLLRNWDYGLEPAGDAMSASGARLVAQWRAEWLAPGGQVVPTLVVDGRPEIGTDAVGWLGEELVRRGVDVASVPVPVQRGRVDGRAQRLEPAP
jgi:2-hydroxychromene-2-carboxylate isomerase